MPEEWRSPQPFVWDGRTLIAPWPPSKLALGFADQQRLDAVTAQVSALDADAVMWLWPDRDPTPVGDVGPGWVGGLGT
jgi:hypothetical protein